jgi:hypothetical protein
MTLNEACTLLMKETKGTGLEVNFSGDDEQISIYWHGVIQLDCGPVVAAKAIAMFRQLETFGAKDC